MTDHVRFLDEVPGASALTGLTLDEAEAVDEGYWCGVCLDFGHLNDLGSCPACVPEPLVLRAVELARAVWAEDHEVTDPAGWEAA